MRFVAAMRQNTRAVILSGRYGTGQGFAALLAYIAPLALDDPTEHASSNPEHVKRGNGAEPEQKSPLHISVKVHDLPLFFLGLRLNPFVAYHARCCFSVFPCLYFPRGITALVSRIRARAAPR
jgi:hypothetical protein